MGHPQQTDNPYERANRSAKARSLISSILTDALAQNRDIRSPQFCKELRAAGADFWTSADRKAEVNGSSDLTHDEVCKFFEKAARQHQRDEDCTVVEGECVICLVAHGDACPACEGRGFHKLDCAAHDSRPRVPYVLPDGLLHQHADNGGEG